MKNLRFIVSVAAISFFSALSNCDPNIHKASNHPCNFPDAVTENFLRSPIWYKIIDKVTSKNLVDTTKTAKIHADSVVLMDENFKVIPPAYGKNKIYEYYIDNWVFTNLTPYEDVPFNDPDALLNLKERIFYLRTAYNDVDTIKISFKQCLINPPILFNNLNIDQPKNDPNQGGTGFYFRK